jgi:hypothetical protein
MVEGIMHKEGSAFASVRGLESRVLARRIDELVSSERTVICELLVHLAELERRSLHVELGYPSVFSYCTDRLRLPKASAFRRSTAARLMARFPEILPYLRSGQLCLTTLCALRDVLQPGASADLLARAAGKTEKQVEILVATLMPQPALPDSIRKRPTATVPRTAETPREPVSQESVCGSSALCNRRHR